MPKPRSAARQHLYQCERCPAIGVAHYLLVDGRLVLVCTACFEIDRKTRKETRHARAQ